MLEPPDIIFVSLENWDEIWRRNQFLCAEFSRRFPEKRILFVGVAHDVSYLVRRGKFREIGRAMKRYTLGDYPNMTVIQPLKFLPNFLAISRRWNEHSLRAQVKKAARELGIKNPLLWLNPHQAVHMAGEMGEQAVIYDITDDWTLVESFSERERELIRQQDRELCSRADLVVVCSRGLEKSRSSLCKNLLLLPNGVDLAHYMPDQESGDGEESQKARSRETVRWPSPVFGYTGTLHPDRIDEQIILALADAFPKGSVVLIGPDHLSEPTRRKLREKSNVVLYGPVSYACIPDYMNAFDVCIVPHRESQFTESLNPIKLWEYLACGKPIVSTNVAGFRDYVHLCRIATGAEAFVDACGAALNEKREKTRERQAEAAKHSWKSRVDSLLARLHVMEPSK